MIRNLKLTNFRLHEYTELDLTEDDQLIFVAGRNGVGKCLPGYVSVYDPATGERLPIEQFVRERRTQVVGYTGGKITDVPVTDWMSLGEKETAKLTFSNGTTLDAALTHPVLTDRGCVAVEELAVGSWVAQARALPAGRFDVPAADGDDPVAWVTITRIEHTGLQECFDITVDTDEHLYVANTTIVHNSSLIESIQYAAYGEGRTGSAGKRAKVDDLVRRGGELEGMIVEMTFDVAGVEYRVARKRRGKNSSATLFANDVPIVEGADDVTAEISRILGMDAAGFRVAVLAQQKELDGLASLKPAERAKMLSRLLRLDAFADAKGTARDKHNSARKVIDAMGPVRDLNEAQADVAACEQKLNEAKTALDAARDALADLDEQIAIGADVEQAYQDASRTQLESQARLDAAVAERDRITKALDGTPIPEPPAATRPLDEVQQDQMKLAREIAEAEAAKSQADTLRIITEDHDKVVLRLRSIDELLEHNGSAIDVGARIVSVESELADADAEAEKLAKRSHELTDFLAEARTLLKDKKARREQFNTLEGQCDRCGQKVDAEHRDTEIAALDADITRITAEGIAAKDESEGAKRATGEIANHQRHLREQLMTLRSLSEKVTAAEAEREDATRRRDSYEAQIARTPKVTVNVDKLYERRTRLTLEESEARDALSIWRTIEVAKDRRKQLEADLADASTRAVEAAAARDGHAVPADLEAAYTEHKARVEARAAEAELVGVCRTDVVRAEERLTASQHAAASIAQFEQRRQEQTRKAMVAAEAAKLIEAAHAKLSTQIRPDLEAAVCDLLVQLSDGRFSSCEVTDDYDIRILDAGQMRSLAELSGGEIDLVALAVRLGLSDVVADRAGAGSARLLILDECLGSQDSVRRQAILETLQTLRSRWGQIWLTSHVGGLDDIADKLVEITVSDDRERTLATVA